MRRVFVTLLMVLLLFAPIPVSAHSWKAAVDKVDQSVLPLFTQDAGGCTAFSIDSGRGLFMSAFHCLLFDADAIVTINGKPANLRFSSADLDIVILETDWHLPALKPYRGNLHKGEMTGALGFALSMPFSSFRLAAVSGVGEVEIGFIGENHPWSGTTRELVNYDNPFVLGMSGGPVFNTRGEVVGVVVLTNSFLDIAYSVPMKDVYRATGTYWEQ